MNQRLIVLKLLLLSTCAPVLADVTWFGGRSPNPTDMSQLSNWSSDPSNQDCTFGPNAVVTNPTLTDVVSPTLHTFSSFQFPNPAIPFAFTISGNNLLELGTGIVGSSPQTTITATTSTTSDLTGFSQISFIPPLSSTTGSVQINATIDNMNNAGLDNQVFFQGMPSNDSPTLVTTMSTCTNTVVNNDTINHITHGQVTFNNQFGYGSAGAGSLLSATNTASNTSTGTNNNTLGSFSPGGDFAQVNFNEVHVGDALTVQATNTGSNDGVNSNGASIATTSFQIIETNTPFLAGNSLNFVANNTGENGLNNSSATNSGSISDISYSQILLAGATTIGNNPTITISNTGTNAGTNLSNASIAKVSSNQLLIESTFEAGDHTAISITNHNQNSGQNHASAVLGNVSYQFLCNIDLTLGPNSTINIVNTVENSGTNAGSIGNIGNSQFVVGGNVTTGDQTTISAHNQVSNTGTNTGTFGVVSATQLNFQGNINAGANNTFSATNSGTVSDTQITFFRSIITGQPTITATNTGTAGDGIRFDGASNTDGATINVTNTTLKVLSSLPNFTLGGINGDPTCQAYFNQAVTLNVPEGQSAQFLGPIHDYSGTGGITKTGPGSQALGGISDFTGTTTIAEGNLILMSTGVLPTDVFIEPDGQLSGNGTVLASVNNQGTIYPGQSVGTLTIQQDYTQTSTGTYLVQVSGGINPDNTGVSSLLDISGTATLDGLVTAVTADGTWAIGRDYLILTAALGLNSTAFSGVTVKNPFLIPTLSYDPDHNVLLSLATQFVTGAKTPNEANVALQFDGIAQPVGDEAVVIDNLLSLNQLQLPKALEKLTGEQYGYLIEVSLFNDRSFGRRIYNALRQEMLPCTCADCGMLQAWSAFEVGYGKGSSNSSAKGFQLWDVNLSVGTFTALNPSLLVGAALNAASESLAFKLGGKPNMYTYQAALYGSYQHLVFYLFSDLVIGQSYVKLRRPIHFAEIDRHAKSTPKINHGNCYVELGLNTCFDCLVIQPYVGADFNYAHRSSLHERGAHSLNLQLHGKTATNWNSYLGVHLTSENECSSTISLDLAWQHRFGSLGTTFQTRFEEFGTSYTIQSTKPGPNALVADINLAAPLGNCMDCYAKLYGEWWTRWAAYSFSAGFSWNF